MDSRFGREVMVGTIVLVSAAIFGVGMLWLQGKSLRSRGGVTIEFPDAGDLKPASPVRVAGVPVGKVDGIALVPKGDDYVVHVTISLPDYIKPKVDASALVRPTGLAGDVTLVFDPGDAAELLPRGQIVRGEVPEGLMASAASLSDRADSVLIQAQQFVGPAMQERTTRAIDEMTRALQASQRLMATFNDPKDGPSAQLALTLTALRSTMARLDSTLTAPAVVRARDQADSLVRNLSEMSAQFRATGARLDSVLARVERGDGTMGRIATDPALYDNINRLTAQMDSLVQDLRANPGKIGVTIKAF
jgi:phospholipid/cholesterol/gamma-HCH transport system substrate-binding protein